MTRSIFKKIIALRTPLRGMVPKIRIQYLVPAKTAFGRRIRRLDRSQPSHSRELATRKIVLPMAKTILGSYMAGLLLVGSAQTSIRAAQHNPILRLSKKEESDVDLVVVSPHRCDSFEFLNRFHRFSKAVHETFLQHGIPFEPHVMYRLLRHPPRSIEAVRQLELVPPDGPRLKNRLKSPFQIIYGKELQLAVNEFFSTEEQDEVRLQMIQRKMKKLPFKVKRRAKRKALNEAVRKIQNRRRVQRANGEQ